MAEQTAITTPPVDYEALVRERYRINGYMHHNFIELEHAELDKVVFRMPVRPEVRNPAEQVNGGALYGLADNVGGAAAFSDGNYYVTQSSSFHFIRNVSSGMVYATGTVVHRGRATCLVNVDVNDEAGRLLATGQFTFFVIDPEILGSKRPADSVYNQPEKA